MDFKDALKMLNENPELLNSVVEALRENVGIDELSSIFSSSDLDAEAAEVLVAEYQRKCGEAISADRVDNTILKQIAGGGPNGDGINCTQADNCDDNFLYEELWSVQRCEKDNYCDEYFQNTCAIQIVV